MKFNSFNFITPCIDDMKRLLFPFRMKYWLKLGFVAMLSGNGRMSGGGGGGNGSNFRIPVRSLSTGTGSKETASQTANEITGSAVESVKSSLGGWYYAILPAILIILLFSLIMSYINSVFNFIFLEALDTHKVLIKRSWRRNQGVGWSFFLFKLVFGLFVFAVLALLMLPMIIQMIQQGFMGFFENFQIMNLLWMIPAFLVMMIFLIMVGVFMSLVYNFSVVHMYFHRLPAVASIRATFRHMRKKKVEVLVFLLARLVIGIVLSIIGALIILVLLLIFLVIAIPFGVLFYFLVVSGGWSAGVIVALVIVGLAFFIALGYVFSVCFLPFSTFSRYFAIQNYKVLMRK
jgi:hypothetical protein